MRANPPPFDLAAVDAVTPAVLAGGERILQTHLYGATDEEQASQLLEWLAPGPGQVIIDMGCGVGEVPRLMHTMRPDLFFIMVNVSVVQLSECPSGDAFRAVLADAHATGLAPAIADAVMFSSALVNMDAGPALAEAARLLRPGGVILLNEMVRSAGDNDRFEQILGARVLRAEEVEQAAVSAGMSVEWVKRPAYDDTVFRSRLGDHADLLDHITPSVWRLQKMTIANTLAQHKKIALEFSGGRDSLACLYLLRPYWHLMTVYWVNTGAAFPETIEVVEEARALVPHFVEIDGKQPEVIAQWGIPTDFLPRSSTPLGLEAGKSRVRMQDSYSCCARVVMQPLHERVVADGNTLIIRGQRADDSHKSSIRSGYVDEMGIEYLFPVEEWTAKDVMSYLRNIDAKIPRFYRMMDGAPDCMTCSGWWAEGRGEYLRQYHPPEHREYQRRMRIIAAEAQAHIEAFNKQLEV